ncbi:MAG: histidine phosphatase family protein, partial [Lachnospiraceae bacterium]|nr:histidine phosphatase family protein [Lachnospiraceae bacterium]
PIMKTNPDAGVLISGHGALNKGLIAVLMNKPVKDFWTGIFMGNCAVNIFEISGDGIKHTDECVYFYPHE